MLRGLELGAAGRQVDEPQAGGVAEARSGVPAGALKEQDDGGSLARTERVMSASALQEAKADLAPRQR
jgi:hypothetical protein